MIIDAKTIILTLILVLVACYGGLQFIRNFALQIAQENHDAVMAMDQAAEKERARKQKAADQAAASAFAKVQPILNIKAATSAGGASASVSAANSVASSSQPGTLSATNSFEPKEVGETAPLTGASSSSAPEKDIV